MFKKLKNIMLGIIAGANIMAIVVMLFFGYADHISPVNHPTLSSLSMLFPLAALVNLAFLFFWLTVKWRMAWIPFLGFLLAYSPMRVFFPVNLPSTPPDDAIKVISFNVGGFASSPDGTDAFSNIYHYLRDSKADIVCLQEDNDTWRKSDVFFDSIYAYNDIERIDAATSKAMNRLGIHTRFPILKKERIEYPSRSNGSVAWFLQVGNDTLIVINNHLESTHLTKSDRNSYQNMIEGDIKGDTARAESRRLLSVFAESSALRAPEAEAVHRYIETHQNYHILLCGDFNDHALSYTRRTIAQNLTDCFVSAGNGLGVSFNRYGMYFRIDHIMCSESIKPYRCEIDSKFNASDHYPVICWLKIEGNH